MWRLLRGRGVAGYKFRRQVHICGWVVDFACLSHCLVIEVDGGVHDEPAQASQDAARDCWLAQNGWQVLRFGSDQVVGQVSTVVSAIAKALSAAEPATMRERQTRLMAERNSPRP